MQLHDIKPKTKRKKRMIVGRGGKRGKTSGRGTKGQKARAGRKLRPELRDIIKKLPKMRGRGKNIFQSFQVKPGVVNVGDLNVFPSGTTVTPAMLSEKKIISFKKGAKLNVKVLGGGELSVPVNISGMAVSKSAREKVEKAGGKIE